MSLPGDRPGAGRAALAAAAAFACAIALATPPVPAAASVPDTERVRESEEKLDEARDRAREAHDLARELNARLDDAAARFEHARAHRLRLEEEAADLDRRTTVASERASDAEDGFARQVAGTYMRPGTEIALAGAIVLAPDPTTAMHRAGMLGRIAARERERADRAVKEATLASHVQRQQLVVQAGVRGAEEDSRLSAEDLGLALTAATRRAEEARSRAAEAEAAFERVVADEERRLEEERRAAAAAARAAEIAARGSGPLPPVDGKVCPIGAPNAFIDSWGFPRSGGRRHQGVDMFAAYGMPLFAVADGVVSRVWNNRLGGLSVNLIDDRGDRYYYAHLSAVSVRTGQRVRAGEIVGANGNSGNARGTPPHLHWQYHPGNGPPVNPYPLARALCR